MLHVINAGKHKGALVCEIGKTDKMTWVLDLLGKPLQPLENEGVIVTANTWLVKPLQLSRVVGNPFTPGTTERLTAMVTAKAYRNNHTIEGSKEYQHLTRLLDTMTHT